MLFDKTKINTNNSILTLINRRRRQILVHSYLYYNLDCNLITDLQFDEWCKELVELHTQYPLESSKAVFPKAFKSWKGFSGYDLFTNDKEAECWAKHKATQLKQWSL